MTVFYRKYRPQKISELDLSSVKNNLLNILKDKENIAHAFLFTGPKGLGKTSAARILAKAINCEENSKFKMQNSKIQVKSQNLEMEPCNECDACISITNGSSIDVLEIDAASNRGVDEIRNLREKIKYAPASLFKKVYIIDEVHMLTTEAFNALLKTLEEPPSHAIFILCTTEFWKLPATIVSRAFVINFEKATFLEMKTSIERIIKLENLVLEDGVLEEIYKLSEGSFRDAAKTIEELSLASLDKKITKEMLEKSFKVKTIDVMIESLVNAFAKRDGKGALLVVDTLSQAGVDFKVVIERTVDYLRKIFLKKSGIEQLDVNDVEGLELSDLNILLSYFNEAYKDLKYAVLPQLPLELVITKWVLSVPESVITKDTENSTENIEESTKDRKFKVQNSLVSRSGKFKVNEEIKKEEKKQVEVESHTLLFDIKDFLPRLIETLKKDNHSIAGVLRSCKTIVLKNGDELEVVPPYKFHGERLNDPKVRKIVEKRAGEILGREIRLSVIMKGK